MEIKTHGPKDVSGGGFGGGSDGRTERHGGRGAQDTRAGTAAGRRAFQLEYAPHFGQFRQHVGDDLIDQLKFIADQGFTALEDNGMAGRPPEEQEKIGREMARLGLTMGAFVAYAEFNEADAGAR